MIVPILSNQVTDAQLLAYADLIYNTTGIRISPQKKTLLSNRLRTRLRATGIAGFDEYLAHLRKLPPSDAEWDAFLEEITTHETFLFRDAVQWTWFRNDYLPMILAEQRKGQRRKHLRIWSAACSTGDEAYTVATCIAEKLASSDGWKIEIIGTDIGAGAVKKARAGRFAERAMRNVTPELRRRFFVKGEGDSWSPRPQLQEWVRFDTHNLLDPMRGASFDLVFLKNVMIYFDEQSKRRVISNLSQALKPGGTLVTGASEGVSNLLDDFERLQGWLHRKRGSTAPLTKDSASTTSPSTTSSSRDIKSKP